MGEGNPLIVQGLHKRYGDVHALAGIDLEVARGEVVALLGPNGAGKTTLMSIVAGLRRPDAGQVLVNGIDVLADTSSAQTCIGLAPQDTGVYPTIPVQENLRFYGELGGLRRAALRRRVHEVAEAFELESLLGRPARALSGGEARRLHTAMALMHRPPLLLLDEPTAGVDVRTRSRLLEVVSKLAGDGSAVVYSTHYLPEVEELDATVAILDAGRLVARGSLEALIGAYGQPAVELRFDGTPPAMSADGVKASGSTLRIATSKSPATEAAAILTELGDATRRLRAVELIQPSLESVFLELTGRRFGTAEEGRDDAQP